MQPDRSSAGFHPYFSTWLASPDQLERTLVGHGDILRDFLARLRSVEEGSPANHFLLVGPRGIGKTHVLCLGGHYVTGRLAKPKDWAGPSNAWACALFTEEEYAGQNSLANFLLTLFSKLQEALPSEELWRLPATLPHQADQAVIDCCFERLERFHREKGTKVLLLIDNLQKVLQQWPEEDHQKLRSFLSRNNLLVVFGSAPSVFREVLDQKAAFHDFFEVRLLEELTNEEVLELLSRRFKEDGREAEYEARKQELARKIPAIAVLAGGNPRLVLFLYHIATRTTFLHIEVASRNLIEELREYFVRRFDELPSQARKVLDTIAQMPGPATPKEIAREARLGQALVNAQLKRLKEGHYVRPVKFQRQKSTRYDITERLFRIWRQTATVAGRQRFRFLADFLRIYFTPEEVRGLYSQHLGFLHSADKLPRGEVLRHIEELYYFQAAGEGEVRYGAFSSRVEGLAKLGELRWAEEEAQYFAAESLRNEDDVGVRAAYRLQATIHLEQGRHVEVVNDTETLLRVGGNEDAAAAAEKLVAADPLCRDGWICLGRALGSRGDHSRALEAYRKAADLGQPTGALWSYRAIALVNLKRPEEALKCWQEAVALDDKNAAAWEQLGLVAGRLGDNERALAAFRRAAEVGKPTSRLWSVQAIALNGLGRREEALKCAEQAVALDERNASAWEQLGVAAGDLGDHEWALAAFRRAAQAGSPTGALWAMQAMALHNLKRLDEALQCAEQAVALDDKKATAWRELGAVAGNLGDDQRALSAFRKAAEVGRPTSALWCDQAIALNNLKRHEEALECAKEAVALDVRNATAWKQLGLAAGSLGDNERALAAFRKAAQIGKATATLRCLEAQALLGLGRPGESLEVLNEALTSEAANPALWRVRALVLLELNRLDEALESLERARENGASPRQYHQDRGDLLVLSGRYAEALKDLEAGLEAEPGDRDLQADRHIALACLGRHGPLMEALPSALAGVQIPPGSEPVVCEFVYDVALRALRRGENQTCLGLLRTSLEMEPWAHSEWFGKQLGSFLRRALDAQPARFVELVQMVRERLKEERALNLLEPFLRAGELLQTKDVTILERLFPEVRELVLDIVKRVDPALHGDLSRVK